MPALHSNSFDLAAPAGQATNSALMLNQLNRSVTLGPSPSMMPWEAQQVPPSGRMQPQASVQLPGTAARGMSSLAASFVPPSLPSEPSSKPWGAGRQIDEHM